MSFTFLYHPKTKQKISLFSKNGKQLLKQYINYYNYLKQHGGMEVEESVVTMVKPNIKIIESKDFNLHENKAIISNLFGSLNTFCNNQISKEFLRTLLRGDHPSNYLIIARDESSMHGLQSIRGFVILTDDDDYLKIDLICRAPGFKGNLKQDINNPSGKELLEVVEQLAHHLNKSYIKLDALDSVITYYTRFGYEFQTTDRLNDKIKPLLPLLRETFKTNDVATRNKILEQMAFVLPDYYNDKISNKKQLEDNGFPMIKVL